MNTQLPMRKVMILPNTVHILLKQFALCHARGAASYTVNFPLKVGEAPSEHVGLRSALNFH